MSTGDGEREARRAFAAACRALARRGLGARELEEKLSRREFSPGIISDTLARLRREHLLDEGEVAGAVARSGERRGLGSRRVAQTLVRRGIDALASEPALADLRAGDLLRARALLARRHPEGLPADARSRARLGRFLLGRGFPFEVVARVLRERGVPDDAD